MLNKGDHEDNSLLRSVSVSIHHNLLTSLIRFAQILFFDRRNKQFHARWFIHGSQTILGELAHGQELFLSIADECENVPVDCLVAKCKVVRISLEQRANFKWPREDTYFYSWVPHYFIFLRSLLKLELGSVGLHGTATILLISPKSGMNKWNSRTFVFVNAVKPGKHHPPTLKPTPKVSFSLANIMSMISSVIELLSLHS